MLLLKSWETKFLMIAFILIIQTKPAWLKNDIETKCEICKDMVENFKKKLQQTENHGFGGGNTDWEESRLGTYSKSESRLLEILDDVCEKVSKESTCHALVEKYETDIYEWWFKKTSEQPELKGFLCVERFKVCCPEKTFGPQCKDCPGGKEKTCNGHGQCSGSGTRSGTGKCKCDDGYEGDVCESCSEGFYDAGNSTCDKCHESCKDTCSGAGQKSCDECKEGWVADEEDGCKDLNECNNDSPVCGEGTYCVNTIGSYECKGCHESCKHNCTGESANHCTECKDGYVKDENEGCKDVDECVNGVTCDPVTYCSNTIGSYQCEECHESCESECKGPTNKDCIACKSGYQMVDSECKDVDECSEKEAQSLCPDSNQYCKNTPGSFECDTCDSACSTCIAPGPTGCVKCNNGFVMTQSECKDVDECLDSLTCDKKTEDCKNTQGSYECVCKNGYRKEKEKCVKYKGNKYNQKKSKTAKKSLEDPVVDILKQGNYISELQLKIGTLLYACLFCALYYFFKNKNWIGIASLAVIYLLALIFINKFINNDEVLPK